MSIQYKSTYAPGIYFGGALAMVISYVQNHSIIWAIIHGLCGWWYVVYYALGYGRWLWYLDVVVGSIKIYWEGDTMKRRYAAYGMMLLLVTMIVTMCHGPTEPTGNSCNGDSLSTNKCPPPKQS